MGKFCQLQMPNILHFCWAFGEEVVWKLMTNLLTLSPSSTAELGLGLGPHSEECSRIDKSTTVATSQRRCQRSELSDQWKRTRAYNLSLCFSFSSVVNIWSRDRSLLSSSIGKRRCVSGLCTISMYSLCIESDKIMTSANSVRERWRKILCCTYYTVLYPAIVHLTIALKTGLQLFFCLTNRSTEVDQWYFNSCAEFAQPQKCLKMVCKQD